MNTEVNTNVAAPVETTETVAEMQARLVELNKKLEVARKAEYKDAVKRIKTDMIAFGIDNISITDEDKNGKPAGAGLGAKVAPKYRAADGSTWTGRGKTPAAFVDAKANGTLNDLLINQPAQEAPEAQPE